MPPQTLQKIVVDSLHSIHKLPPSSAAANSSAHSIVTQKEDRYGCLTTADSKRKFVFRFEDLLAHGGISYHSSLVSSNPFVRNVSDAERAKSARMEFERQLRSFRRVHLLAASIQSNPTVAFSGKVGPDNKNTSRLRDDMVMAALLGIYWSGQYLRGLLRHRTSEGMFEREFAQSQAPIVRHLADGGQEYADRQQVFERENSTISDEVKRRPSLSEQLSGTAQPPTKRARA